MLYIFIAVFVVLVVMNIFMIFVLRQMTILTGKQVEKDAVRLMAVYDTLLEKKSEQLRELNEKLAVSTTEVKRESPTGEVARGVLAPYIPEKGVRYHDTEFTQNYQKIKDTFLIEPESVISQVSELEKSRADEQKQLELEAQKGILEKISFDSLYQIATLEIEEQQKILKEVLEPKELEIYETWKQETKNPDMIGFFGWLKIQIKTNNRDLIVRTGNESEEMYQFDSSICEGVKVMCGDTLYDFSI